MPLTEHQKRILAALARSRAEEGHLAEGAALHFSPNSIRYSHHLDFFHDSNERVASAHAKDLDLLEEAGYAVELVFSQPGYIRAIVFQGKIGYPDRLGPRFNLALHASGPG